MPTSLELESSHLRAASWDCPYCDADKEFVQLADSIRSTVLTSLTAHVHQANDAHGPRGTTPADFSDDCPDEYVTIEPVDGPV